MKRRLQDYESKGGGRMNKAELVEEVANQTGLTKKVSREVVDAVISTITDSLAREEKVTLVGFGTFQVMERKTRKGVNPQTRESIQIPAKKVPKFRPGRGLRERVK
jgi:DNA-binding protein HU-beta